MNAQNLNLNEHLWKNRIIIIKTLNNNSLKFKKQIKEFENQDEELAERKLVIYHLIKDNLFLIDYQTDSKISFSNTEHKKNKLLDNPVNGFEIILIGLDGSVKIQRKEVVEINQLYSIIDAMPMRQIEMKNKR